MIHSRSSSPLARRAAARQRAHALAVLLVLLVLVPALVGGGYWYFGGHQQRQIEQLERRLEEQRVAFETELSNLLSEQRRAEFRIIGWETREGQRWNTIRFVEFLHADGEEIAFDRRFEMPGTEIYIDALTVKFDADAVRAGRGRNFAVFRRAFSNAVAPEEGVALFDATLKRAAELAEERAPLERRADAERYLELLLGYMADPDLARADGVRVIEGQANYTNPRPGFYYELVQQASGSLIIVEREIPRILRETP